jgi:hypothetical protein
MHSKSATSSPRVVPVCSAPLRIGCTVCGLVLKGSLLRFTLSLSWESMGCTLVVCSGEFKGRYVGHNFSGLRRVPEIPVPGTGYSLFSQPQGAAFFPESVATQVIARLENMGVHAEAA